MLGVRMRKILGSGVFWGAVALFVAIMVAGDYEDLQIARDNSCSVLYLYIVTSTVGIAHVLVPAVTIVPFAFFYVEEMDKKAVYYNLARCSKRAYYLSNIVAAVLSPMLVSALALLAFFLVCLAFGAGFSPDHSLPGFLGNGIFITWLGEGHLAWVLLVKLLAFVLYSSPWGVLCLAVSALSRNKYVVIAFPFIIQVLFSYSMQLLHIDLLDPGVTLLKGPVQDLPGGGIFYALAYHGVAILVLSAFYYAMSKRRFRHEGI